MTSSVVFGIVLASILLVIRAHFRRRNGLPYPPGPSMLETFKNWRTLGHGMSVPQWRILADQRKVFGDIFHLSWLGSHVVVLNTYTAATEYLDKRGAKFSGRPVQTMLGKLGTWGGSVVLSQYGAGWREKRKFVRLTVNKTGSEEVSDDLAKTSLMSLKWLVKEPQNWEAHLRLAIGGPILKLVYGISVEHGNSPFLLANEASLGTLKKAPYGMFLVDFIPALQYVPDWVPFITFKTLSKELQVLRTKMLDPPFQRAREETASGKYTPSMASSLLETGVHNDEHIKLACGSFYSAGVSTTLSALRTVITTMMLNPEAQAKVHAEIDELLGDGTPGVLTRLPEAEDRASLPYLDAVMKEALRWHVATPMGIAHAAVEDDIVGGHYIPKGTVVLNNLWSMSRDEQYYDNPEEFRPERHLGDSPQLNPYKFVFGWGRRVCVGQQFAHALFFSTVASMLACFDVLPALDENGQEKKTEIPANHGGLRMVFDCRMVPRSNAIAELIEKA